MNDHGQITDPTPTRTIRRSEWDVYVPPAGGPDHREHRSRKGRDRDYYRNHRDCGEGGQGCLHDDPTCPWT